MVKKAFEDLIEKDLSGLGYEFIGLEHSSGNNRAIYRLYIDSESGITHSDCQKVTKHLNAVIAVAENSDELSIGDYVLEVSSPGVNRKIFKLEQCTKHIGSLVKVNLRVMSNGRKKLKGKLIKLVDTKLWIELSENNSEDKEFIVDYKDVESIRLVEVV